jgi:hypothetical protein
MNERVVVGVVSLVIGMVAMISASMFQMAMVDAVNRRWPAGEQISPYGWYLGKTIRLLNEYRRLYPDGRLLPC